MKKILSLLLCMTIFSTLLIGCANENVSDVGTASTTTEESSSVSNEETTTEDVTTQDVLPEGVTFKSTQVNTIKKEDYIGQSKYKDFLNISEKSHIVPALEQNTVPQGLAYSPSDGRVYITSYSALSNTPSVILALNADGDFVAEYFLYNSDGTPFVGHVGGIALTEHYMYIALGGDGNGAYSVGEFKISDLPRYGSHDLKIIDTVSVPSGVSYLSYNDGILWTGNFYIKGTYDLGSKFNFTTSVDGKAYGGYAAAYRLDKNDARLVEDESLGYAKPDYVLATPDKVQGLAYDNGKVVLSISYGRKNDSYVYVYKSFLENTGNTVKVDGVEYKFDVLGSKNLLKSYRAIPMSEGITVDADGKFLLLFESAAIKYSDSLCPTDRLWRMDF